MSRENLTHAFIEKFGRDTYTDVIAHAGTHATRNEVVEDAIPDDEYRRFLYGLVEMAEYECGTETVDCEPPVEDEALFRFLISHYRAVAEGIEDLPPRGTGRRLSDLGLIYPTTETADVRVEIGSDLFEPDIGAISMLGYDQRTVGGGEDALLLVCLIPCTDDVKSDAIPETFPVSNGTPTFTNDVDGPVEVLVPVPETVWKITSDIAPGFMTLDGWDIDGEETVQVQIGVVDTDDPSGSRVLLNSILGDDDEWPNGK